MKWGFAGYGRIARKFEIGLNHIGHDIAAIASRSGAADVDPSIRAYDNYDDLMKDPEVDIVYVSTTHNTHAALSIAALNAGKHVLCEKPMATSSADVKKMTIVAQSNNRFLMEAIWTRYLPGYQQALQLIRTGAIGTVVQVNAHFGFWMNPDDPKQRLLDPKLAAGAIWDVGIYPISLTQDVFGESPKDIQVVAELSEFNVEDRCAMQFSYGDNRIAQLSCAVNLSTINNAVIAGTHGHIIMKDFWKCEEFTVIKDGHETTHHHPMTSNGLCHEAMACKALIEDDQVQSPLISWQHSIQLATIMDKAIKMARD